MRKVTIMAALLLTLTAGMLVGCSKKTESNPDSAPVTIDQTQPESVQPAVSEVEPESPSATDGSEQAPATDGQGEVVATVVVNISYADGSPDVIEVLDINGVSGGPDGKGYDNAGKLIYERKDTGSTDANGALNVTITYEFYSLDYDFDYRYEPMDPENGGNIQSITGKITKAGGDSKDFTFETIGIRGQTGIWYAGICSCRNGVLGDYTAE